MGNDNVEVGIEFSMWIRMVTPSNEMSFSPTVGWIIRETGSRRPSKRCFFFCEFLDVTPRFNFPLNGEHSSTEIKPK
jgi:hypothetical protein